MYDVCMYIARTVKNKNVCLFSTVALVLQNAAFGQGTGPIALDNVNCLGNETNITMCVFLGLNTTEDTHAKDASIKCFPLRE